MIPDEQKETIYKMRKSNIQSILPNFRHVCRIVEQECDYWSDRKLMTELRVCIYRIKTMCKKNIACGSIHMYDVRAHYFSIIFDRFNAIHDSLLIK